MGKIIEPVNDKIINEFKNRLTNMTDKELTIIQLGLLKESLDKEDRWASSKIVQNAIDLLGTPIKLEKIIENLKTLRTGIFKDVQSVNKLIDETIKLAETKASRHGRHLIIYQDIKIMPDGFCGLIVPYWRISLTDGSIEMSCDKKNWMPTESRLRIELEQ